MGKGEQRLGTPPPTETCTDTDRHARTHVRRTHACTLARARACLNTHRHARKHRHSTSSAAAAHRLRRQLASSSPSSSTADRCSPEAAHRQHLAQQLAITSSAPASHVHHQTHAQTHARTHRQTRAGTDTRTDTHAQTRAHRRTSGRAGPRAPGDRHRNGWHAPPVRGDARCPSVQGVADGAGAGSRPGQGAASVEPPHDDGLPPHRVARGGPP